MPWSAPSRSCNVGLDRRLILMDTKYRFVVDVNVGRLARWLRVMGYDTVFFRQGDDNELVCIALKASRVGGTRASPFARRWLAKKGSA